MNKSEALRALLPAAAARAGAPGGVCFSARQLFYEVCRGLRADETAPTASAPTEPPLAWEDFQAALDRFPALPGLLPTTRSDPLPLAGREPDLATYGLPRLLLSEDDDIAAMLRANLFPMELGCAVLGMPEARPVPSPYDAMLKRARRPVVFALHSASADGLAWAAQCATACRLPRGAQFRVIGLRPAHAMRLGLTATRLADPPAPAALPPTLSAAERAWLTDGWSAEIAAVAPVRLLRTLRRIVLQAQIPPAPVVTSAGAGFLTWP